MRRFSEVAEPAESEPVADPAPAPTVTLSIVQPRSTFLEVEPPVSDVQAVTLTLPEFATMFTTHVTVKHPDGHSTGSPGIAKAKDQVRKILPGIVKAATPGTRLRDEHVTHMTALMLDVGDFHYSQLTGQVVREYLGHMRTLGYRFAWHRTYRSTPYDPRFRVVVPFAEPWPIEPGPSWPAQWERLALHFNAIPFNRGELLAVRGSGPGTLVAVFREASNASRLYCAPMRAPDHTFYPPEWDVGEGPAAAFENPNGPLFDPCSVLE